MTREEKIAAKQKEMDNLDLKTIRALREFVATGDLEAVKRLMKLEEQAEAKRQDMRNT